MSNPIPTAVLALSLVLPVAGMAQAANLPPLSENTYINERLVAAKIGDIIRKACPSIEARRLYAIGQALKLKDYALRQGYSSDEIDAFVSSKTEKQRVRATAEAWLAANGAVEGDPESYCVLGREEIARGTITGTLLQMN